MSDNIQKLLNLFGVLFYICILVYFFRQQKDIFILIVGLLESAKMAKHKNLSEFDRDESDWFGASSKL